MSDTVLVHGATVTETLATQHLGLHYRAGICGSFDHCSFTPPTPM